MLDQNKEQKHLIWDIKKSLLILNGAIAAITPGGFEKRLICNRKRFWKFGEKFGITRGDQEIFWDRAKFEISSIPSNKSQL